MERRNGQKPQARQAPRQAQQSQTQASQAGQQNSPRQQQQFDAGRQQAGGSGGDQRLASQIREHMDVVDQNEAHVGTVDHVDGDRIKLTRSSSGSGEHQFIPLSQVAGIEGDKIRLRDRGDASFGMEGEG